MTHIRMLFYDRYSNHEVKSDKLYLDLDIYYFGFNTEKKQINISLHIF